MDKLNAEDLTSISVPLKATAKSIVCPECNSGTMMRVTGGKTEFNETLEDSYGEYQCTACEYTAMLPMALGEVEYSNANLDISRSALRDEFGHSGVISMIWARTHNYGIGHKGDLPWGRSFPSDLAWFKKVTSYNEDALLVVGSDTYAGLPPLEGRKFAVLTSKVSEKTPCEREGDFYYPDIPSLISDQPDTDYIVVGGGYTYSQWMPLADLIYETVIVANYPVDTFCPMLNPNNYDNLDSFLVRNCDDTGKDAIFNVWMARKVKGTLEEHLIKEKWNFSIRSMFNIDTSNA